MKFTGSICLSDIPLSARKLVTTKSGEKKWFINVSVHENKEPRYGADGKLLSDHFISCAPKKDERVEGDKYIIGNLRAWEPPTANTPTADEINAAPSASDLAPDENYDLPF